MASNSYPFTSYYFKVTFDGSEAISFQSVKGLEVTLETEDFLAGGENRFTYKLPKQASYSNLVLTRGWMNDMEIINWCKDAFYNQKIELKDITVSLMQNEETPISTWKVVNAFPKKWTMSEFNAQNNAIAIESIELQYQYFEFVE